MKNRFTQILFALVLLTFGTNAQSVYNSGFEQTNSDGTLKNWGNVYLTAMWIDSTGSTYVDSIVHDGGYYYAPTADANYGLTALELRNSWNFTANKGISGAVAMDDDSIFSAYGLTNFLPTYSTPFNQFRPFNFGFYHKFTQVNGDTAYARIELSDSMGNPVGSGLILITDPVATYTLLTIPIDYVSTAQADFYMINIGTFYSIETGSHDPSFGTRLTVDDVGFNLVSAGTNELKKNSITAYPNPASDFIILKNESGNQDAHFLITDISGREIVSGKIADEKNRIDLSDYERGIYILKTGTEQVKIILK